MQRDCNKTRPGACNQNKDRKTRLRHRINCCCFLKLPPCATYVLTYLISECKTLLCDAHRLFISFSLDHVILNSSMRFFIYSFRFVFGIWIFCLASALYTSFICSDVRTYLVHKAQVGDQHFDFNNMNWREFESFTAQEYHACTNNLSALNPFTRLFISMSQILIKGHCF